MVVDLEISFDRFPYPEIYKKGTVNWTPKIGEKFKQLTGRKDFGIEPEFFRPVLF